MKYPIVLAALFSVSFVIPTIPAHAQAKPPKEMVEELSKAAFDALITVKNPEGQTVVKPEDAKKLQHPMISYDEREKAVARGYLSAYARWCKLEWQKDFFAPYVKSLRVEHKKSWSEHQYAYAEVLHGLAMGIAAKSKKDETCPDTEKKRLSELAKK